MIHTTLIDTDTLANHLDDPDWAVVDCRYSVEDPDRGGLMRATYLVHVVFDRGEAGVLRTSGECVYLVGRGDGGGYQLVGWIDRTGRG